MTMNGTEVVVWQFEWPDIAWEMDTSDGAEGSWECAWVESVGVDYWELLVAPLRALVYPPAEEHV